MPSTFSPIRPKLVLHVGPAKTGTSAVQHALREHDGSVVLYPKIGLWPDGSHHNLVFNHFGDTHRTEIVRADPAAMFAQIGDLARATPNSVVISSEALAGPRAEKFIAALLPYLDLSPADVEIIVVCREHFARAASLYSQRLKDAHALERRTPGAYLRASADLLCIAPLLGSLGASGYKLHVMNYHPADSFVARFLAHIGFPPDRQRPNDTRNVSLSTRGMIALLAANRVATTPAERRDLAAAMRGLKNRFRSSGFLFDTSSAAAAEPIFAADRQTLHQDWRIDLPAVDLARQADQFCLSATDLDDLRRACRDMGPKGEAIVGQAQEFMR